MDNDPTNETKSEQRRLMLAQSLLVQTIPMLEHAAFLVVPFAFSLIPPGTTVH